MPRLPPYPYVDCPQHGEGRLLLGYCVCRHILEEHAVIAHTIEATSRRLGEMLCEVCHATPPTVDDLRLICARCVENLRAPVIH